MINVDAIFDWLLDGAVGASNAPEVVARLNPALVQAGVPVDAMMAFVRTLHPHIAGRRFTWYPGAPVAIEAVTHAYFNSESFLCGPMGVVFRTGEVVRTPLVAGVEAPTEMLKVLAAQGMTEVVSMPLPFMDGTIHGAGFSTRRPGGFHDDDIQALKRVTRPLARVAEIFALTRTAVNLLDTYIGHSAGERVLGGRILRGDTETIRAVIWFSDLRGFTSLSSRLEPRAVIRVLNDLFDCQVPAIESAGGEVLKFMGDGLLAIVPIGDSGVSEACGRTLQATAAALRAIETHNAQQAGKSEEIRVGIGLHVGDVAYGNIGGPTRLDFTCIGPAVNLASRLEGLTSKLGRQLVVSSEFARQATVPMESLGRFALKGVPQEEEVFAPAASAKA